MIPTPRRVLGKEGGERKNILGSFAIKRKQQYTEYQKYNAAWIFFLDREEVCDFH